jgi:predicted phosphohydrolase
MKIVYCSDLHVDITQNNLKLIPEIYDYLIENKPDVFVIAGDLANSCSDINNALTLFKELEMIKIFIPGNHDLWIESKNQLKKDNDSFDKYTHLLSEICKNNNFFYPIFDPLIINDIAFIGTVGWYDYSIRDKRLDELYNFKDYDNGVFGMSYWGDVKYSIWLEDKNNSNWKLRDKKYSNKKIFDYIFNLFKQTFYKIPKSIKNIYIISHMAPFQECIIPKDKPDPFDAYEGSIEFGNFIKEQNKKIIIICGHRHKKIDLKINKNIRVLRAPFGYLEEKVEDFKILVKENIGNLNY